MATTTNYGWTTPDDTGLVKDGASAIRTLGTSVDTTTKNLNPSTTLGDIEYRSSTANTNTRVGIGSSGQALTVVAGVPSWAASATSVLSATGDTLYASAANTLAKLAIGSTNQVLTVSGGVPTWANASSGGMTLLSTTTLSGATTTLSSINQTYNSLYLVIENALPASDGQELRMRFNGDSGANRHCSAYNNAFSGAANAFDTTYQRITINNDNAVSTAFCTIEIPNYTNTTSWKFAQIIGVNNDETTTTSIRVNQSIGAYNQTAAISSLAFFFGSGNATSGTIKLYGVK
jgi:hypothetical protein